MSGGPSTRLLDLLAPLLTSPRDTAILTDFDGTLATIADDPATVSPLTGAVEVLARLAVAFGRVAVVSGRPVSFLIDRLGAASDVVFVGLYGLERSVAGTVVAESAAEPWRSTVELVTDRLTAMAPDGTWIEGKGLTVTAHWRTAPTRGSELLAAVEAEAERTGLIPHLGRMNVELRPPVAVDKGSAVTGLVQGRRAACYLGDDLGDIPAFAALDRWAALDGNTALTVAAVDAETSDLVANAANVTVEGPLGALGVLRWLADASDGQASGSPGA